MAATPSDAPGWTRSPWIKWSWLLVLVVVVARSLNFELRSLPTTAGGYFARGRADFVDEEFESAVENFTKSIALRSDDADLYILRGVAYAKLHELGSAMPDLEKALQLQPEYGRAHAASGDGKAAAWDAEGAIAEYSRAIATDRNYARCYLERGKLNYDTEKWDDAEADLRRGADLLRYDDLITTHLLLWLARAHAGGATGATIELSKTLNSGKFTSDRFRTSARFLCGQLDEAAYLAAMPKVVDGDEFELGAEASFLAGVKRLVFGDRAGAVPLLQKALEPDAELSYAHDRARVELENLLLGFHARWSPTLSAGLEIASVAPGGRAEAAGIRPGFILTSIDGAEATQDDLVEFLASAEPGSTVELQLLDASGARTSVTLPLTPGFSEPTR